MSVQGMGRPLIRLARRPDRRRSLILALLAIALGSVVAGLAHTVRGLELNLALLMATLGLMVGWGLAVLPVSDWAAAILLPLGGLGTVLLRVGRLGVKVVLLFQVWLEMHDGVVRWLSGGALPDVQPAILALVDLWSGLLTLLARIRAWFLAVWAGQPVTDPVAVMLVWSLILWVVSAWAGWMVRRHNQPLPAVTPAGALLVIVFSYSGAPISHLLVLLGATLPLLILIAYDTRVRRWWLAGTDAADLAYEVVAATVLLTVLLVSLAGIVPTISWHDLLESMRDALSADERGSGGDEVAQAMGVEPPALRETIFGDLRAGGLPRRHLLGSGPELSKEIVMTIRTGDLPPRPPEEFAPYMLTPPRYYWRGITYDVYIRTGWSVEALEEVEYEANEPIITPTLTARRVVNQEVHLLKDTGDLLFAAGDLIAVDQPYAVAWRAPEDIFAATVATTTYVAKSVVSTAGEAQLRAAGDDYPQWVRDRYLTLPRGIPARVLELARDLTATEPTPYDRARAIEAYLRTIPYSLDVSLPPRGQDVVDYFLFDLRTGYCDYYATAMVVLARAAGIPARLAVGYATGSYDRVRAEYVVTEASAHAWPEIYFPGYGWIEFEPTAGLPPIERAAETAEDEAESVSIPRPASDWQERLAQMQRSRLWSVLALMVVAVVAWPLADLWRLRRLEPAAAVMALYRRLQRRGRRLAVPVRAADTPYEFAALFADRVAALAQDGYSGQLLAPAAREAQRLADLYVQVNYSARMPDVTDRTQAIQTWLRLHWRLWLGRALQGLGL